MLALLIWGIFLLCWKCKKYAALGMLKKSDPSYWYVGWLWFARSDHDYLNLRHLKRVIIVNNMLARCDLHDLILITRTLCTGCMRILSKFYLYASNVPTFYKYFLQFKPQVRVLCMWTPKCLRVDRVYMQAMLQFFYKHFCTFEPQIGYYGYFTRTRKWSRVGLYNWDTLHDLLQQSKIMPFEVGYLRKMQIIVFCVCRVFLPIRLDYFQLIIKVCSPFMCTLIWSCFLLSSAAMYILLTVLIVVCLMD